MGAPALDWTVAHQLLEKAPALRPGRGAGGQGDRPTYRAQLDIQAGDLSAADALLAEATPVFVAAHAEGWRLQAEWLRGVVARRQGRLADAQSILTATLQDAARDLVTQMVQRCTTSWVGGPGRRRCPNGSRIFARAVELVDRSAPRCRREEFRMGFVGDKLTPYAELVRLCLADGAPNSWPRHWGT